MIGAEYFSKNTSLLREEGRLVFINATQGSQPVLDIRTVMQKRLVITGSMLRSRSVALKTALAREIEDKVWPILEKGLFRPVIYKKFPLADASGAHALMERGEGIGKIILVNGTSNL